MEYEKENKIISIFHDIIINAHLESFLKDSKVNILTNLILMIF